MLKNDIYELTNPQKLIWMTEQFYSGTNINNIVGYLKIEGNTDFKILEQALNIFVSKNDSFKTKITIEDASPLQYFDDFIYESIEILDLKDDNQLLEFENSFPKQTIKVLDSFLFMAKLLRFPDGSGILVLSTHHLITDAWTMSLCLEEIYNNYNYLIANQKIDLTPNPSYLEFINSQKKYMESDKFVRDSQYWQNQFTNLPNIISLKSNSSTSINANRSTFTFDEKIINKINIFCKENNISDYIFLLGIFSVYFKNLFNCDNFVIGNPVLNRSNFKEKHMTGMFVSIMPFIIDFKNSDTFKEFCHFISNHQKTMYRHIRYPYHEILDYVRKTHDFSNALYDVVFSYQNAGIPSYCKWLPNHSQVESLQIHVKNISTDKCNLSIMYDFLTDIFSEEYIELLHSRIINLIDQVLDNNEVSISNLEIISKQEKNILLKDFNNTNQEYDKHSNIIKDFEKIAKDYPNKVAVIDKNSSLTYEELNNKANYLANDILNLNLDTPIIAFCLKRSIDIAVTILAILKSGHTYMPIDPEYPTDRINFMLENSNSHLLITYGDFKEKTTYSDTCICYENLNFDRIITNLNIKIPYDKICYTMYTSGSTGIPKAVCIKHYNVLNFTQSIKQRLNYKPSENNIVLSVTTVCFDIFVFEFFPTLLSGLTLVFADELESRSPQLLSDVIKKYKISKILTTPSRIELLFSDISYLESLSNIKEFILGGEPLQNTLLAKLKKHTNAKIFNLYGPTETTVYSTFKDMTEEVSITIGKPINNTQIYILNDNYKLQPIGQIGEICIGGDGVGSGYYNNPEKTNEVFIKNPYGNDIIYKTGDFGYFKPNGELICLGRKDYQVKIRGYRVELDDISNNILSFKNIDKCVVVDKTDNNDKKYLCAYIVSTKKIRISELKKYLVDILPHYMIPTHFIQLDKLPLTINHKIDRNALPDPNLSDTLASIEYAKPTNETEKKLCLIFENCINIPKIGINDDIFDYNLDSLDIIKVQTKMLEYEYRLNTQEFYKCRTIKKLSNLIDNKTTNTVKDSDTHYLSTVNNSFYKHNNIIKFSKDTYNNILLIGCTGYLGIHVIEEILNTTSSKIYCIVRPKDGQDSLERLSKLYRFYFNKDLDMTRVIIFSSDVTNANLGLLKSEYDKLSKDIDLVLNTAANVKYYGNYSEFKKINVTLVSRLIDFCIPNSIKFIHISTLGVSGNYLVNHEKNYSTFDENDFFIGQNFEENVYIQTKFEAEKLIYEKISEGLLASILRVGNLTGRYYDGVFQKNFGENAFYNILLMILKYHILPNTIVDEFLEFTPVDFCAKAICNLTFNVDNDKYLFHIFNDNYISVSNLLGFFANLGHETNILSGNEFKQKILSLSNQFPEENILKGIVNDLDDDLGLTFKSSVSQKNIYTNSYLNNINFVWPKITQDYIKNIITYLKNKKYL